MYGRIQVAQPHPVVPIADIGWLRGTEQGTPNVKFSRPLGKCPLAL